MQVRRQQRLAGGHPVAVAAQGVDLAVVRDVPVRVRQRPRRERVGGEPGVHQRQRAGDALVGELGVERLELRLGEHALVDQRARREAREVGAGLVLGALAQAVRAALEGDPVGSRFSSAAVLTAVGADSAAATNSWRNDGMAARALGPMSALSTFVGSSRQPSTRRFSSAASSSIRVTAAAALSGSVGRNAVPTAYAPAGGSSKSTTARRKASGTWMRMPTPSPVLSSAPRAPRCSRRRSAVEAPADDLVGSAAGEIGHQGHTTRVVLLLGGVHAGGRGNGSVARGSQEFLLSSQCTPTPASGRRVCASPPHPLCSYPRPIGGARGVRVPDRRATSGAPAIRRSPGSTTVGSASARPHAASRAVSHCKSRMRDRRSASSIACATLRRCRRRTAGRRALGRCRGSRTVLRGRHRGVATVRRGLGTCQGAVVPATHFVLVLRITAVAEHGAAPAGRGTRARAGYRPAAGADRRRAGGPGLATRASPRRWRSRAWARLVAPLFGDRRGGGALPDRDPGTVAAALHWRPGPDGPWLWWAGPAGARAAAAIRAPAGTGCWGRWWPLSARTSRSRRGCCGATRRRRWRAHGGWWSRPGRRWAAGPPTVADRLLTTPPLRRSRRCRAPEPPDTLWTFRRRSCCLYYRVPGGGICGDCVLVDRRRRGG